MIDLFLNYLRYERNRSEQTVLTYGKCLRYFERYFKGKEDNLDWASVDADVIRSWMENMMDRGEKATSVATGLSAVRSFYRFALARGLVKIDPAHHVQAPKKQKPLPQFVKEAQMDSLLDASCGEEYKDVRARTIIILLYEAGLRRAELIGLDDDDVDFSARQLKVTGKRNKQRLIPFGEELANQLKSYMAIRDGQVEKNSEALFLGRDGLRISQSTVYNIVKEQLRQVSTLKKCSPHVLRHSFATAMLNHDAGLEGVKKLLGHESLETTEIYTHTTFEQLRRIYKEAHPRG
jgi:integrase/recombinase XerC